MRDFPKQYKQTKTILSSSTTTNTPFTYFPQHYTNTFDIEQLFVLFVLDALYLLRYQQPLGEGFFLPAPHHHNKESYQKDLSFLKKQLKQFGLFSLANGLQTPQDPAFQYSIQQLFANYFREKIIFEDRFLVYRSPKYQTPISSDTIEHIPSKKNRYTIKYFVSTKNHSLDVQTDSPETIFGDVAIALHPQHKKAKQLKGQEAIIPIINKTIPIIIDERADFTRYGGIYRVTPGHDKLGLAIAKDHNLPIDTYAIDKDGYFTEHAGIFAKKLAEDFFSNIIQSLSDIGNLTKTESLPGTTPICQQTGEHLIFRSWKGLFVKIPDQSISSFFSQPQISCLGFNPEYIDTSYRIASAHQPHGIPVPLGENESGTFVLDAQRFVNAYQKTSEKQGLGFGLFLFHCISTQLLPSLFSSEDFISMIFDCQEKDSTAFSRLFSTIELNYPQTKKEFSTILNAIEHLEKEKSLEKNIAELITFLDNACYLKKAEHGKYQFSFETLDQTLKGVIQQEGIIHHDFIATALLLQKAQEKDAKELISFYVNQSMIKAALKSALFVEHCIGYPFLETIHIIPDLKKEKENHTPVLSDIAKMYHQDCIRLGLLSLADNKTTIDSSLFDHWDQAIATFWNACRYIKTTFYTDSKAISLKKIYQHIEKNISGFSAFDSWILSKGLVLIEEHQQIQSPVQLGTFVHHVFEFIQHDFSSKYIELIKSASSEYSTDICLCVVATLLSYLRPYLPTLTQALREIFGFDQPIENIIPHHYFDKIQKNYSISLFMEIIDKFSLMKNGLRLKKHDVVGIFIRSNPDFIKFAKNNESLFKKTLHADDIVYLVHHEEIPTGYTKEDIIDISIGIKPLSKQTVSGITLLQKQLEKKEEYLQHLKHLIQQLNASGADDSLIQQKKEEISDIKKDIEKIAFEISKFKMKE